MPCCHLCHKSFTVASLSGHMKKCHSFNNVSERKHILNLCNKRTNIRRCPCPVPGCGVKGQFLERHMDHVHKELRYDQLDIFKDLARRRETDRLLQVLRDTNPEIPLTTTWENNKDLAMDPTAVANLPARRDRPCHKPGCQVLQQRFLALQRNWRCLKAELQKAKRELWAFRRPSGAPGPPEAEANRTQTIPVPMSLDQCVQTAELQVKMNSPDSSRDISIKQEPEDHPHLDQCVQTAELQVKMNSPDPSRDISIKQEPEDHPHLEVSPKQESSPSLLQEEPEPPHIKEEEEELLQRPVEPAGITLTLLAVESEDGDEDISSHCFEVESDTEVTEDSDDWDETSGGQSASNTRSITRKSSFSRTHTGEKPFRCTLCNKCFAATGSLNRHQRIIHTGEKPRKTFHCPFCGKSFRHLGELEKHQVVHTGEKPFRCTLCDKCFTSSRSLKNHERIHTGETPYQCTHCGKTSRVLGNLKTHQNGHPGENPFHCKHCDKSFT